MVWCLSSRGAVFFGAILGLFWEGEYWVGGEVPSRDGSGKGGGRCCGAEGGLGVNWEEDDVLAVEYDQVDVVSGGGAAGGGGGAALQPFFWCTSQQPAEHIEHVDCSIDNDSSKAESDVLEKNCSRKRSREEACGTSGNKACREKMRRDRLNDRFLELSAALEPGRPPKTDKATILNDAVRILTQLRTEAQGLQESNDQLRETIKDLKTEKNELRDEKSRLKADKERLEQQVKAMTFPPGYMPHPAAIHAAAAAYAAQTQAASTKAAQMAGYPGMAMWQWMPPAAVDTSQDHVLRAPVA